MAFTLVAKESRIFNNECKRKLTCHFLFHFFYCEVVQASF